MGTAGQHIAWTTPSVCGCACLSCDLCEHDEPEATITRRPPERAPEPRPVRQVQRQDTAELVFGGELVVY